MSTADAITQLSSALAGRYEIHREIGHGGMATVYLARDIRHSDASHASYDVAPDGRFLMLKRAGAESQTIVVHNWARELREKTAGRR